MKKIRFIKDNEKFKICLTTYFDKNFEKIGNLCLKGMRKYAKKYGYDLRLFKEISSDRPPAWNKILITHLLFNDPKNYDFVFWIDSDTLFWRFDEDIAGEIEDDKDFYLCRSNFSGKYLPLTGAYLIRNSKWAKNFLQDVWNLKKYTYHNWWENAAVDELLGYKNLIDYHPVKLFFVGILYKFNLKHIATKFLINTGFHKFFCKIFQKKVNNSINEKEEEVKSTGNENLKKTKWLDLKWDSLIELDEAPDPIIMHYPAMSFEERLKKMTKDFKKIKNIN